MCDQFSNRLIGNPKVELFSFNSVYRLLYFKRLPDALISYKLALGEVPQSPVPQLFQSLPTRTAPRGKEYPLCEQGFTIIMSTM